LFYGSVRSRHQLPQLTLTETEYKPGFQVPLHRHEDPWFGFVLEGSMTESYGGKAVELRPFTLMFRRAGEAHSDASGKHGGRCFMLEVKHGMFDNLVQELGILQHSAEFEGGMLPSIMLRLYEEFKLMDNVGPLSIEGLTLELLAEAHRRLAVLTPSAPPQWLKRAMELVRTRFAESVSLSQIAEDVGTHPVHLARAFRKYYGHSIGEYIRKLRVQYAYGELLTSDQPIINIAFSAGFCDQAHLSRTFKRLTGMSPSELRKSRKSSFPSFRQ
jgi:AraC family transcriptional regulator